MTVTSDQRAPNSGILDPEQEEQRLIEEEEQQASVKLPEHQGRVPSGMKSKIRGASNRTSRPHSIGDKIVGIIELTVDHVGHEQQKKNGLIYTESLATEDFYEIIDGDEAKNLLAGLRQQYRAADDARHGRTPLFDAPAPKRVVWADANGYVLSNDDLAERRGEEPSEPSDADLAAAEEVEAHEQVMAPQWLRLVEDGDTEGYDRLKVPQIMAALKVIDERPVIIACSKYEAAEKNRAGLRKAFDARLSELSKGE